MNLCIQSRIALKPYNSFGMDVLAEHFCQLDDLSQLPALLADSRYQQGPVLWLGGGSNLLLTRDYPGLVVKLELRGIRLLEQEGDSLLVEAAAGENWHQFVRYCLQQGWYGLENLSLIPGTVGACPVQNIGAYGVEVKDCIAQVVCADLTANGASLLLDNVDCQFAYRDSIFKHQAAGRLLVTAVRFRLSRQPRLKTAYGDIQQELEKRGIQQPTPLDVSDVVMAIRASKLPDPAELGNAGSFFKNPVISQQQADALLQRYPALPHYPAGPGRVKLAAGWLIDQAGLKGYRQGDAAVHARQALVLVNHGSASGSEMWALARLVQDRVHQRYGVELEAEPLVL